MSWAYYVNGVEQTFWRRIYPTKTFKMASGVVLAAALGVVQGEISLMAAVSTALTSSAVILIRGAMTKLELSNAALNPDLLNVVVLPKGDK